MLFLGLLTASLLNVKHLLRISIQDEHFPLPPPCRTVVLIYSLPKRQLCIQVNGTPTQTAVHKQCAPPLPPSKQRRTTFSTTLSAWCRWFITSDCNICTTAHCHRKVPSSTLGAETASSFAPRYGVTYAMNRMSFCSASAWFRFARR